MQIQLIEENSAVVPVALRKAVAMLTAIPGVRFAVEWRDDKFGNADLQQPVSPKRRAAPTVQRGYYKNLVEPVLNAVARDGYVVWQIEDGIDSRKFTSAVSSHACHRWGPGAVTLDADHNQRTFEAWLMINLQKPENEG